MNVQLRIHPAIGVARVGTAASAFFLGPETEDEPEPPVGGFRDDKGDLKPQAARFRVFARIEDGGNVSWLTTSLTRHRRAEYPFTTADSHQVNHAPIG